jgi:antitoxin ParD1/3/4
MHVSLSPELEAIIKERVQSGMYANNSEVIRSALRHYFQNSEDQYPSDEMANYLREIADQRLKAVEEGATIIHDFDTAMVEIEQDVFGKRV